METTLFSRLKKTRAARRSGSGRGLLPGLAAALLLSLGSGRPAAGQVPYTIEMATVRVSVVVRASPAQIKLVWSAANGQAADYRIWRKAKADLSWGSPLATVPSGAPLEYADNTVALGTAYEYRIQRGTDGLGGNGYVYAGVAVPAIEDRGTVVLLVADTHAAYLAPELAQLVSDLRGDGWQVLRHDVAPTLPPPQVKALIVADYQAAPAAVNTVFIVGHVAVPYAGDLNPDEHPDHQGAWPADVYYGTLTSTWTDTQVNNAAATRPENQNVPGDGKFDQSDTPTPPALAVGRVDLSNLPAYALPERELLRQYLRRDHDFRHRAFAVAERGLVDDHFGLFYDSGEAFVNNGWRNFAPLVGEANTNDLPYRATLATADYLLAYACGPGYYDRAGGVGTTADLAAQPVKAVFNMLFGSYFGDWDNENNFLRAPLASSGYALTSCWAGRPNWQLHHLGLGETVGYATFISQTRPTLYERSTFGGGQVHVALMGDPTLRLHTLAPPTAATATASAGQAALSWTASPEPVAGYYVYRAASPDGPFVRLSPQPVPGTTFADAAPLAAPATYLVRAVALKTSPSGSYYNLSQGAGAAFAPASPPVATWLGSQSADWRTPANWSTGRVPTAADAVVVGGSPPFAPQLNGPVPAEARSLSLQTGARLTIGPGSRLVLTR